MIPDKIYIWNAGDTLLRGWTQKQRNPNSDVEYIRKEAILEWAIQVKQGLIIGIEKYGEPNEQRVFAFQEFIDKLNSL